MKDIKSTLLACLALAFTQLQTIAAPSDLDPCFNLNATPRGLVWYAACQADGKVVVSGRFDYGLPHTNIARLNADGSLDDSFHANIFPPSIVPRVRCLTLQNDRKILVGGFFFTVNGVARTNLARLNPDGSLDVSFLNGLEGPNGGVSLIALQNDGRILIYGGFTMVNGFACTHLARLNGDGSLDGSFTSPLAASDSVRALVLQTDGRIVLGGYPSGGEGQPLSKGMARLLSNGALDSTFLNGLSGITNPVYAGAVQPDGKIVVGGQFDSVNDQPQHNLARLNADGSLDTTFLDGLAGASSSVSRLALQSDGKILVSLGFSSTNGWMYPTNIARVNANGSLDFGFLGGASGPNSAAFSILPQTDGRIVISGPFSSVNRTPAHGVARLIGDHPVVLVSGPGNQTAEAGAPVDLRVQVSGCDLVYQWFLKDGPISGATNTILHLGAVSAADMGPYTVVATNAFGAVTSAPAMLQVIPPVERRPVPAIQVTGELGHTMGLDYYDSARPGDEWEPMTTMTLSVPSQYYFDISEPLPPQRFYRGWTAGAPGAPPVVGLPFLVPAITLTGTPGSSVRVDGINRVGPADAWFTLDTVTLTNATQLYFDVSAPTQPTRLYRLVPVP